MKNALIAFLLTLASLCSLAAIPSWSVDETQYSSSMTVTAVVMIDGSLSADPDNMVAAFVGDECRGVARILPSASLEAAFAYLMVFSNGTTDELVRFKIYDSSDDEELTVADSMIFVADNSIGTQTYPYVFANQKLGETIIDSFSTSIVGEKIVINDASSTISITLPDSVQLTAVPVSFASSIGSFVMLDTIVLKTGDSLDLTHDIVLSVVSQTGSVAEWRIITTTNPTLRTGNDILSFGISVPGATVGINQTERLISLSVPPAISTTLFKTNFILSSSARLFIKTVEVNNGDNVEYSDTVRFTVMAENGVGKQWTAVLARPVPSTIDTGNAILAFGVGITGASVSLDAINRGITINVPADATRKAVTNFSVSADARVFVNTIEVKSGAIVDYSSTVQFVVVSESGDSSIWTASIASVVAPVDTLLKGTDILSFGVNISDASVTMVQTSSTIALSVPFDAPAKAAVSFSLSEGARLFVGPRRLLFGDELTFASDTALTVVSEAGDTKSWEIVFTRRAEPLDTGYALLSFGVDISGAVVSLNDITRTISILAPKQATSSAHTSYSLSKDATLSIGTKVVEYGSLIDYTKPVVFKITSEAGKSLTWTATLSKTLDVKVDTNSNIISFGINIDGSKAVVDTVKKTVVISAPADAVTKGVCSFTLSQGATLFNGEKAINYGDSLDLTTPKKLSVVSASGKTVVWTISLVRATTPLDTGKSIVAFAVDAQGSTVAISEDLASVVVNVPTAAPSFCVTTFTLSKNATLFIGNKELKYGDIVDYSNPVACTVKAQDGSVRQWTLSFVRPVVVPDSGNAILAFGIDVAGSTVNINPKTKSIVLNVGEKSPSRCATSFLVSRNATLSIGSKSYASGDTIDYSSAVTITVTAQNGTASSWTAKMLRQSKEPNDSGTAILSFAVALEGSQVTVDAARRSVLIGLPKGSLTRRLATTFVLSNAASLFIDSVAIASGDTLLYDSVVTFTVKAQDGRTSTWTATAYAPPLLSGTAMNSFTIVAPGTFVSVDKTKQQVTILVPADATSMVYTTSFALSEGATLYAGNTLVASNSTIDYASVSILTVVSEDGQRSTWTVVVEKDKPTGSGLAGTSTISYANQSIILKGFPSSAIVSIVGLDGRLVYASSNANYLHVLPENAPDVFVVVVRNGNSVVQKMCKK